MEVVLIVAGINDGDGNEEWSKVEVEHMVDDGNESIKDEHHNEKSLLRQFKRLSVAIVFEIFICDLRFISHVPIPDLHVCEMKIFAGNVDAHLSHFVIISESMN